MRCLTFISLFFATASTASAATLSVGPDKQFARIEPAVKAAHRGDTVKVFPQKDNQPYRRVAVQIKISGVTITAADPEHKILLNGNGYDYSGRGPVPRAIFQFDPSANGCSLIGFDLSGGRNKWGNGAGVRINAANHITIKKCAIHDNDMGIMSNGKLAGHTGKDQQILACHIYRNGSKHHAGYNHNLYLGGSSALIRACEIDHSTTGHNLKSRCHLTCVEYCYIHDSANRELDLVDAKGNTDVPHSDAIVLGCLIKKAPHIRGNHAVIHFGRDGKADHNGTLYLIQNTLITPYPTAVIQLSSKDAAVKLINNRIKTAARRAHLLATFHHGNPKALTGAGNQIDKAYEPLPQALTSPLVPYRKIPFPQNRYTPTFSPLMHYIVTGSSPGQLASTTTQAVGSNADTQN